MRNPQPQLEQVISYIRAKWPFYDRRGACCVVFGRGCGLHAECNAAALRSYGRTARGVFTVQRTARNSENPAT